MTKITQADRDAAKEYDPLLWEIKPSCPEFQNLIQAFARHRLAERAKIVAWLRSQGGHHDDIYAEVADDIEDGAHETFTRSSDT